MALANFFGKNALAAHHVLGGMNPETFADLLSGHVVAVAFDDEAAASPEGQITAELASDMAARLYPRVAVLPLVEDGAAGELADRLRARVLAINPDVELVTDATAVTIAVVVGEHSFPTAVPHQIYAGSESWHALISPESPLGCGNSTNPFGAAAAACFAMANVFRVVFGQYLPVPDLDVPFGLSLFNYHQTDAPTRAAAAAAEDPSLEEREVGLGETFLAGVGAIGNAVVWALARVSGLRGTLNLIDHQSVALSNLQRYVLATQEHASEAIGKVDLAAEVLRRAQTARGEEGLVLVPHGMRWGEFLAARNDWRLERLVTAFDTVGDRVAAQAALPRRLLNAWTQLGDLGVSRHFAFGKAPCLACLYPPRVGGKSEAELIGESMGFPGAPDFIRDMLVLGFPIGEDFVREVAKRRGMVEAEGVEVLLRFSGGSLREFYNEAFCGGLVLELGGSADSAPVRAEAPMVFQSALAGIMLAAEIVIDAAGFREGSEIDQPPVRTVIDLLRPLPMYLAPPAGRRTDGLCLCNDADYVRAYTAKYSPANQV